LLGIVLKLSEPVKCPGKIEMTNEQTRYVSRNLEESDVAEQNQLPALSRSAYLERYPFRS
jgi:hypothetical protein